MVLAQTMPNITPYQAGAALLAFALLVVGGIIYNLYLDRQPQKRQRTATGRGEPSPPRPFAVATPRPVAAPAPAPPVRPPVADSAATDELRPAAWLQIVTNEPDRAPHFVIAGESGTGKTTVAQAMLAERGGLVAIADPKPTRPGAVKWAGMPYASIGAGGDYRAIEALFVAVLAEVDRRLAQMRQTRSPFVPLTIICDEWLTLLAKCESAVKLYELATIGRELGMRLILLSTSDQVKSLKLDGRGDLRENFRFLRLGDKALGAQPACADQDRPACLEWRGKNLPISLDTIYERAAAAATRADVWPGVLASRSAPMLGDLLVTSLPDRGTELPAELPRVTAAAREVTSELPVTNTEVSPAEVAFIAVKLQLGNTPSQVAKMLPGYSPRNYKDFAAKVAYVKALLDDQGLGEPTESEPEDTTEEGPGAARPAHAA